MLPPHSVSVNCVFEVRRGPRRHLQDCVRRDRRSLARFARARGQTENGPVDGQAQWAGPAVLACSSLSVLLGA